MGKSLRYITHFFMICTHPCNHFLNQDTEHPQKSPPASSKSIPPSGYLVISLSLSRTHTHRHLHTFLTRTKIPKEHLLYTRHCDRSLTFSLFHFHSNPPKKPWFSPSWGRGKEGPEMPSNFPRLIQLEISQGMIRPQVRLTPSPCSFHNATEPPVLPLPM